MLIGVVFCLGAGLLCYSIKRMMCELCNSDSITLIDSQSDTLQILSINTAEPLSTNKPNGTSTTTSHSGGHSRVAITGKSLSFIYSQSCPCIGPKPRCLELCSRGAYATNTESPRQNSSNKELTSYLAYDSRPEQREPNQCSESSWHAWRCLSRGADSKRGLAQGGKLLP